MIFTRTKFLAVFMLFAVLFVIGCSSTSDSSDDGSSGSSSGNKTGVLQDTTVTVNLAELYSKVSEAELKECNQCVERKVPSHIWAVMEETSQNYTQYAGKEAFCLVNDHKNPPGEPFEVGAKVEIIGFAGNDCKYSMLMRPGSAPLKLPTSFIQIRVTSGEQKGKEGWTWTGAVKRDGEDE